MKAQLKLRAQPVPQVNITPQPQPTTRVIIVDRETRQAKVALQELEGKAKDGNMTPADWKKIQSFKSQIAVADQEQQDAEQSSE